MARCQRRGRSGFGPTESECTERAERTANTGGDPRHRPAVRRQHHQLPGDVDARVSDADDRSNACDGRFTAARRCARHSQDSPGPGDHRRDRRAPVDHPVGAADWCSPTGNSGRTITPAQKYTTTPTPLRVPKALRRNSDVVIAVVDRWYEKPSSPYTANRSPNVCCAPKETPKSCVLPVESRSTVNGPSRDELVREYA